MRALRTYESSFLKREKWWVAWCNDVPGALTQGRTLAEAKANLRDAIRLMQEPADLTELPRSRVVKARIRA